MTQEEKLNIIDIRTFNYYFGDGEEVQIDDRLINEQNKIGFTDFTNYIGKPGIVKRTYSDFHAFGRGCGYNAVVDFGDGIEHDIMCAFLRYSDKVLDLLKNKGYDVSEDGNLVQIKKFYNGI